MTKETKELLEEMLADVYADGCVKLPFKYKDGDVYEATYKKLVII